MSINYVVEEYAQGAAVGCLKLVHIAFVIQILLVRSKRFARKLASI